jgi:hypothetical protein
MRRIITMALAALAAGFYLGTPAPVSAEAPTMTPAAFSISWGSVTPTVIPASKRRIEVVDQLKPSKWRVSQAAEWLDRYTASNMVTVSRCSGHAWKCVTIRGGKLGGSALALTQGNRITVDTAKVDRHGYRSNLSREKILAHELFHTFGYGHTRSGCNLMRTSIGRVCLAVNSSQRAYLRKR